MKLILDVYAYAHNKDFSTKLYIANYVAIEPCRIVFTPFESKEEGLEAEVMELFTLENFDHTRKPTFKYYILKTGALSVRSCLRNDATVPQMKVYNSPTALIQAYRELSGE